MRFFTRWREQIQHLLKTEKRSIFCIVISGSIHLFLLLIISLLLLPAKGRLDGNLVAVELAMEAAFQASTDKTPLFGEPDSDTQPDDPTTMEPTEEYNTDLVNQKNLKDMQEVVQQQENTTKKELEEYLAKHKKALEAKKQKLAQLSQTSGAIGQSVSERSRYGKAEPQMFYGVRVIARKIVFVLDISGSMDIDDAKLQLRNAYQKLKPSECFNLIVYADDIKIWKPEIVEATPDNIQSANQWIEQLQGGGSTNLYGALEVLFESAKKNRPEIVYFLSDGLPTAGVVQHPLQILSAVQTWNKNLGLVFCVIGLGPHQDHDFLGTLAKQNQGQYFIR